MARNKLYQTISIIGVLIFLHSCVSENQEIVKDDNGVITLKCELKKGVRDGKCYEYYPNGAIRVVSSWIAGVQDGPTIEYFENGEIRQTSMWKDEKLHGEVVEYSNRGFIHKVKCYNEGKPIGLWVKYYEGIPISAIQYVVVKDHQQYMNQWWTYGILGDVQKEESHYYSIYSAKGDSVKVGEQGEIKVKLEAPLFGGYMKLVTGNFDYKFNPIDSTKLDTINCVGFEGTVKYRFDEKGKRFIQGIILDCKKEEGYDEKGRHCLTTSVREIYFMKALEVH